MLLGKSAFPKRTNISYQEEYGKMEWMYRMGISRELLQFFLSSLPSSLDTVFRMSLILSSAKSVSFWMPSSFARDEHMCFQRLNSSFVSSSDADRDVRDLRSIVVAM